MSVEIERPDDEHRIVRTGKGIEKQIHLPLSYAISISFKNVKLRLGRAIVTSLGICLGIAFLMAVVSARYFEIAAKSQLGLVVEKGISMSDKWLIGLSLFVSVLGIANSLLMSVTERFREIGTMKCLGALDRFIVELFLFECVFLGILGSTLGVIIGVMFSFIQYIISYGFGFLSNVMYYDLFIWCICAFIAGVVLSGIGGIYPAYIATQMKPADALRSVI